MALQSEPSGLGAQILFSSLDSSDVSVGDFDEDGAGDDDDFKHTRNQFDTPEQ